MRVYKQPKRIGGFANTLFVLRAARARFTVYHADDDRLNHDGVVQALDFMAGHPDYSALYAPVETYDLATDQSLGRKVGVISHVQEMTERIATRVLVRPAGAGSSAVTVE